MCEGKDTRTTRGTICAVYETLDVVTTLRHALPSPAGWLAWSGMRARVKCERGVRASAER